MKDQIACVKYTLRLFRIGKGKVLFCRIESVKYIIKKEASPHELSCYRLNWKAFTTM